MRIETISRELYQFDELSDKAKETAREWYRQCIDVNDFEPVIDDAKAIGKLMGIDIKNIYYDVSYTQGAGACFEGSYSFLKGSVKAIKDYAPLDKELHAMVEDLLKLQKKHRYKLGAKMTSSSRYFATQTESFVDSYGHDWPSDETHEELCGIMNDFSHWIFKRLRDEYEWLNSNESVDESIRINEYEFTVDGKRA